MSHAWIEERAGQMAYALDSGQSNSVIRQLQNDSINDPESFAYMTRLIQQQERNGLGDDLNIRKVRGQDGYFVDEVSVDVTNYDRYGRPHRERELVGYIDIPPISDVPYAHVPHDHGGGIDGKSAVIGGIVGLVLGRAIEKHNDRHDDRRRDRDWDRDRDRDRDRGRDHDRDDRRHHHDRHR